MKGISGISQPQQTAIEIHADLIRILNEKGSKAIGKPVGNYVTLEMAEFIKYGYAYHNVATELVKKELEKYDPYWQKAIMIYADN